MEGLAIIAAIAAGLLSGTMVVLIWLLIKLQMIETITEKAFEQKGYKKINEDELVGLSMEELMSRDIFYLYNSIYCKTMESK